MINKWFYVQNSLDVQQEIKKEIKDKNLKTLDIGGSYNFWSYPECLFLADLIEVKYAPEGFDNSKIKYFPFNIQNEKTWDELLNFVENNGKFDYIICSHTLEDIIVPTKLLDLLPKLGKMGYIAIPSKYNEFKKLYNNPYRGNAHHKQIIDIKNDEIIIYPKYSFIEVYNSTNKILEQDQGEELCMFWSEQIPYKYFAEDIVFSSDGELINYFFNQISTNY